MSKKIITVIFFTLLVTIMGSSSAVSAANTLYVGNSVAACNLAPGSTVYSTVSLAIAAASPGDTIQLCNDIVETTAMVDINKDLTITSRFNGVLYNWTVRDNDNTNPIIQVTGNLIFDNLLLDIAPTTGWSYFRYIIVDSVSLTISNSYIYARQSVVQTISAIRVISGSINISNSNVSLSSPPGSVISYLIEPLHSNVSVNPSNLTMNSPGYLIAGNFDGSLFSFYTISISSSLLLGDYSGGLSIYAINNALVQAVVNNSSISVQEIGIRIQSGGNSEVYLDVLDSGIWSIRNHGMELTVGNYGKIFAYVDPSAIFGGNVGVYTSAGTNGIINFEAYDTSITGEINDAFYIFATSNGRVYVQLFDSVLDGLGTGSAMDMDIAAFAQVDILVEGSILRNYWWYPIAENGLEARVTQDGVLNVDMIFTDIMARQSAIYLFDLSDSNVNLFLSDTWLSSEAFEELDIWTSDPLAYVNGLIEYSYIDEFSLSGPGTIDLLLYETFYDEVNSYNIGHPVYSEWTLDTYLISKAGSPIAGGIVTLLSSGIPISSVVTDNNGLASHTLSYTYDSNNPFITQLILQGEYRGASTVSPYTDFEQEHTLPSWFGNIEIEMDAIVLKVFLAGNLGFGNLYLSGSEGRLIMGSKSPGGWLNYYPVKVTKFQYVVDFSLINIKVLYKGTWVDGYILVNNVNNQVYVKFGGTELYGYLR